MNPIPSKYKAIVLPEYNQNVIRAMLSLKVEERQMRELQDDEILIKMEAAPCNPSDIAFLQGQYNIIKSTPTVPGFEGAGTVIAAGSDPAAKALTDKRVSCFTQDKRDGTWSEYFITSFKNSIVLKDEMPIEQAACFAINPFTAYGLFERVRLNKSTAIIQNAAGSHVGKFVRKLARKNNTEVINIVRKKKYVESLQKKGQKHVLVQDTEDFAEKLTALAHTLNATTAIDAVAGELSGIILSAMPDNSELLVYGGLSSKPIGGIDILDIIFHEKHVAGFDLNRWIESKTAYQLAKISNELQDMFITKEWKTSIQGKFNLSEPVKALKQYLENMSEGKILFVP